MSVQIIERDGNPEWAVIPYKEYLQLVAEAEMLQDVRDYDTTLEAIEKGEAEIVPAKVVYSILDGENPIRVWREFRRLTQRQLADMAGISTPYLSQLESGKRAGTTEVLTSITSALNLTLEDIVKTS